MPLLFTLAILLIIGAAILYSSNPQLALQNRRLATKPAKTPSLEQLKAHEFLGEELTDEPTADPDYSLPEQDTIRARRFVVPAEEPNDTSSRFSVAQQDELLPPNAYQPVDSRTFDTENSHWQPGVSAHTPSAANGQNYGADNTLNQAHTFAGRNNSAAASNGKPKAAEMFSPYMAALSPKEAESLNKKLEGLPGAIEAAILRALLPKSKKDTNIEKYLARHSSSENGGKSATPFASVEKQFATQKASIMGSMKKSFGTKAANQAGQIMDAYQQEISNVLNQGNLTPEQMKQKTAAINNKYNEKLKKLSEKSGMEKLKEDREKQDSAFEQNLANAYGSDIAGQLGDIMSKYREQGLQLAQQPDMTVEEYYKQALANERAKHKEMQDMLLANGKSLQGLRKAEDEEEKRILAQLKKDEDEGKVVPQVYQVSDEEKTARAEDRKIERDEKHRVALEVYGEEGAAVIDNIYNKYNKRVEEILNDTETSELEKRQAQEQARREANEQLAKVQQDPQMRELRENKQVDTTLSQLMKDPAFERATPQQLAEFEEQARPLLHDMFARINEVNDNPNLSDVQKEQQIRSIQTEFQRQLAGE